MSYFIAVRGFAARVHVRREELLLMIEARTPRQHAADVQSFAFDLPEHVGRIDSLGGRRIVRATSGVDVMVAAEEAMRDRVDPALESNRQFRRRRPSAVVR